MTEIYLQGDLCYVTHVELDKVLNLINDPFILGTTLLPIQLINGFVGYFRKDAVVGINEVDNSEYT